MCQMSPFQKLWGERVNLIYSSNEKETKNNFNLKSAEFKTININRQHLKGNGYITG